MIPADGVYVSTVKADGQLYQAVTNIGKCPTLKKGDNTTIETHTLDADCPNLYEKEVEVYFHKRLRDEVAFDKPEALLEQVQADAEVAQEYHREHPFTLDMAL